MEPEMAKYFRAALSKYRNVPDWDDAVQEAIIYYWQNEDKYPDEKQRRNYAAYRGKGICTLQTGAQGGKTMTGHLARPGATEGHRKAQGELTRNKIKLFVDEYKDLNNGKHPTNTEISKGTGIHLYSIGEHLKRMHTYGMSVAPQDVKLQALFVNDWEDGEKSDTSIAIERSAVEWEDDSIDRLTVQRLMQHLTDKQRDAVYYTYWMGMTTREVGKAMGISQTVARGHLKAAHDRMRKAYESN